MKLGVYARDYYCDDLYDEIDNWCYTSYKAKFTPSGEVDIEDLIKNMIEKGWLGPMANINKFRVVEKATRYLIYIDVGDESDAETEPEFYIDKMD